MRTIHFTAFLIISFSIISCENGGGDNSSNGAAVASPQNQVDTPQLNNSLKSGVWLLQKTLNNNKLGSKIPYIIISEFDDEMLLKQCGEPSVYLGFNYQEDTYQSTVGSYIPALKKTSINGLTGFLDNIKWEFTHYKDRTDFGMGVVSLGGVFGDQRDNMDACSYWTYSIDSSGIPDSDFGTIHVGMTINGDTPLRLDFATDESAFKYNDGGIMSRVVRIPDLGDYGGSIGWSSDVDNGFSLSQTLEGNQFGATFTLENTAYGSAYLSGSLSLPILF